MRTKKPNMMKRKYMLWTAIIAILCIALTGCDNSNQGIDSQPTPDGTSSENYDVYTVEGITISVPEKYADLVIVEEAADDGDPRRLFSMHYKPARDAHTELGWMFSIMSCSRQAMIEMLNTSHDGITFKAVDGDNYFYYAIPTDVQWYRPEEGSEYNEIRDSVVISYGDIEVFNTAQISTFTENTRQYFYTGQATPEDAALNLAQLFMEDLIKEDERRTFSVTEYKDLSVSIFATQKADRQTRTLYQLNENEIADNMWIVEISVSYKYDGIVSPIGPSNGEWIDGINHSSEIGFLLIQEDGTYMLQSRYAVVNTENAAPGSSG